MKEGQAWVDARKYISVRGKRYQYGSSHSAQIVSSSNAQQKPSWRAHDLSNCRARYKMAITGVRRSFQRLIPGVLK
jgi:hypothetical protein